MIFNALLLYTYLLTFWAAPTIVMVASNHAAVGTNGKANPEEHQTFELLIIMEEAGQI